MFIIEDEAQAELQGKFNTFQEALAELKRRKRSVERGSESRAVHELAYVRAKV